MATTTRSMRAWPIAALSAFLWAGTAGAAQDEALLADVAESGDRARVLAMIETGADVNAAQSNGTTALHWAAYKGDTELARALLEHGAQAAVTNAYGATPLAEAVNLAVVELVELLLEAGADPDSPNADGQTALMLAVRTGAMPVAELLVLHGANVNATETWKNQTALMWAAGENFPDMAEFLIAHGAEVNVRASANDWERQITSEPRGQYRPRGGLTPLLYAARSGCLRCAAAMIEAGADVDLPDPDGVTPLVMALDNYQFDTAKLLLEHGANPHISDWSGRTPLYVAVDMNTYLGTGGFGSPLTPPVMDDEHTALELARMLLEAGVDPNVQLALHRPDRAGQGRFLDDVLRTGATPLLRAALDRDVASIQLLLDHGADVNLPNVMGVTPLMVAAGMGTTGRDMRGSFGRDVQARALEALAVLIAAGADVNARVSDTSNWTARIARSSSMTEREGQTALYTAAGFGWAEVVAYLIEHGARVDVEDASGKTPLDAARAGQGGRTNEAAVGIIEQASVQR